MRFGTFAVLAAASIVASRPAAGATGIGSVYGYVDWTTDYRFYGLSESNRQPAAQGGLHWLAPDGFYAGVFVSQVDFRDFRNTDVEADFYAGKHLLSGVNDLNLEVLYGMYPDSAGHPSYAPKGTIVPTYNFVEAAAEYSHSFGLLKLSGKVLFEPSFNRLKGDIESVNGSASYPLAPWLTVSASAGHQWASTAPEGTHWDIGLTATHEWRWAFDVRYYGSDVSRTGCYRTNWCEAAVVAKLTYTFQVF